LAKLGINPLLQLTTGDQDVHISSGTRLASAPSVKDFRSKFPFCGRKYQAILHSFQTKQAETKI
jgi:hypothetical protein